MLDEFGRRKLKQSLQRNSLVEPLVWNKRTGNLVGGHQRLDILDELHGGQDYELDVSVIDVDEARERELNVILNNPAAQGSFDLKKLVEMIRDTDVQIDMMQLGFDKMDLNNILGSIPLTNPDFDAATGVLDTINEIAQTDEKPKLYKDTVAGIKERKIEARDTTASEFEAGYYMTIVFSSNEEAQRFCQLAGLPYKAHLDGFLLAEKLGIDLLETEVTSDDASSLTDDLDTGDE